MVKEDTLGTSNTEFAPSTTSHNPPPLRFHAVHGKSVCISRDGKTARRVKLVQNGETFSARPVRVNEKVCFRLLKIPKRSIICFGFTSYDPTSVNKTQKRRHDCLRFMSKPGNWYRLLDAKFCKKNNTLCYYFDSAGKVYIEINGVNKGMFYSRVDTNSPLWALVDLVTNYIAVQFVDPRERNQDRKLTQCPFVEPSNLHGTTQAKPAETFLQQLRDVASSAAAISTDAVPRTIPHNPPPLRFHAVHGESVRVSRDGTAAKCMAWVENGQAFSARPVKIYEKVCFRFHEISVLSSIFFGFTSYDPTTLAHELTFDTISFLERNCYQFLDPIFYKKDNILSYYFDSNAKVHFEINWFYRGALSSRVVMIDGYLWASVVLEYTALQFIDPDEPKTVRICTRNLFEEDSDSLLDEEALPPPIYPGPLEPLRLHRTKGKNVQFVNEVAARIGAESCQGYVFSDLPIRFGQNVTIVVQILATESSFMNSLAIGLTSCDPATLRPCDLPDDVEELLDRPEYWMVIQNVANNLRRGHKLVVTLTSDRRVQVSENGSNPVTVGYVDYTGRLWMFMDIYGATKKVRLFITQATRTETPTQLRGLASSSALTSADAGSFEADDSTSCSMSGLKPTTNTSMFIKPRTFEATATPQPTTGEASSTTPHNTQPLRFHTVHGNGVRISRDGTMARRVASVENSLAFSARPVRIYEKVCFRLHEISDRSAIFFGFTSYDPSTLAHELTVNNTIIFMNKPGNCYQFLNRRFYKKDDILSFYFDSAGIVHFEINWCHRGVLLSGVDRNGCLWALVVLEYTALQLIDPEESKHVRRCTQNPFEEERLVTDTRSRLEEKVLSPPKYPYPLEPLSLHRTKGRRVQLVNEVAARVGTEFCQGYVFTALPMRLGQTIVIQILATEPSFLGSLAIGLTSCDPATLRPCDLPNYATELLDRPEYWVVRRNAADGLRRGDELAVTLTTDGEVQVRINSSNIVTVMHVDCTVRLWAFVDIYGATQKVRLLTTKTTRAETPPQQLRDVATSATPTSASTCKTVISLPQISAQDAAKPQYIEPTQATPHISLNIDQVITLLTTINSALKSNHSRMESHHSSTSHNNSNQQLQMPKRPHELNRIPEPSTSEQTPSTSQHYPLVIGEENLTNPECILCFENPVDCVLYKCGHMCMCYSCGAKQWQKKRNGKCPICREVIRDIIRTYKS